MRRRSSGWRLVATAIAALSLVAGLGGCAVARNGLGTKINLCARVLPAARRDVGPGALFLGVRWLSGQTLVNAVDKAYEAKTGTSQVVTVPPGLVEVEHKMTCMVAFKGNFSPEGVKDPWAPLGSPYTSAIVVLRQSDSAIVVTVLSKHLPRALDFFREGAFFQ